MIPRSIMSELEEWMGDASRKPLIIRGARQVGKTTAIHQFSVRFDQYLYLNLEFEEDRAVFNSFIDINDLLERLFFFKNQVYNKDKKILIFIDEIQAFPPAVESLRYFYEKAPHLFVIAAGSLLETLFDKDINFPVGRVNYKLIRPLSFLEFLDGIGETNASLAIKKIPIQPYTHNKMLRLFHRYALMGGMPEIISHYNEHRDLTALGSIYEDLLAAYMDDIEKYVESPSQVSVIRHAIRYVWLEAGNRIKFQGFGNSNYGSREMGEALRVLQQALLIHLVYPHTQTKLPIIPDHKKFPRLQVLDSGLMNYFLGIQKEVLNTDNLHQVYKGKLLEHLVGQELLAIQTRPLSSVNFWVREKKTATAEIDYLYPWEGKLIPIEVKFGKTGRLRSLHLFMDDAPHKFAIRLYAGELRIDNLTTTSGKKFHLLNLPYYLVTQISAYLGWFVQQV